ncbi:MAG: response regulator [Rhodospirillales bacterium]|nr:response regulator [Rhodospirillales bacterium]
MQQLAAENIVESEQHTLSAVAEMLTATLLNNNFSALHESLDALTETQSDWVYLRLSDRTGVEIYPLSGEAAPENPAFITITHRIHIRGTALGEIILVVDPRRLLIRLENQIDSLVYVVGLILLGSLLAILFFVESFISAPSRKLSHATQQLATGNFDVKVPRLSDDEIGTLTKNFVAMRDNLMQSDLAKERVQLELKGSLEAAEGASLAKSNFLSTMSHEIRTPLNGVLGLAQLLRDTNLDTDQRKKVDTILASGETLLSIINDVLDMSKIEARELTFETTVFNLKNLVSTIASPFYNLADSKGVNLQVKEKVALGSAVKGDPVRIRQILWNLLSNAIKFTEQGSVTLIIETTEDAPGFAGVSVLRFSIIDSGAGIAPDRVDAVFEAFTQADSSITRKHGGTGLGLSIVKQLTELMGGTIDVSSVLGKGSTFTVCLPCATATAEEANAVSFGELHENSPPTKPMNIVVAEDNEVNAIIATAFLKKFGHRVKHVVNGRLAVEAVKDDWADLVLMDVHMPEMNGIDATRAIRMTESGRNLPIVGLTAEAFTDRHAVFMEAGMNSVLTKPFTEQQLANALAFHGDKERRRSNRAVHSDPDDNASATADSSGRSEKVTGTAEHPASHPTPVGDKSQLDNLRRQLSPEIVSTLLIEAQLSLRKQIENMRKAVEQKDSTYIRETAHAIKGASGSLFAVQVSEMAERIENKSAEIDAVLELMPDFEIAVRQAMEWWHLQAS